MVFLETLLDLPILWQSSTSLDSTLTSIFERIDVIVDSKSESCTLSRLPEITKTLVNSDENNCNSTKSFIANKNKNVKATFHVMNGKMLVFAKISFASFVYDIIDGFCFLLNM